jgi:hypothetical protein
MILRRVNMFNPNYKLILFIMGFLLIPSAYAGNYTSPRVLDGSLDEGARIYRVICPNDKKTTIRAQFKDYDKFKKGEICYKNNGNDECSKSWNVDDAAAKACDLLTNK